MQRCLPEKGELVYQLMSVCMALLFSFSPQSFLAVAHFEGFNLSHCPKGSLSPLLHSVCTTGQGSLGQKTRIGPWSPSKFLGLVGPRS